MILLSPLIAARAEAEPSEGPTAGSRSETERKVINDTWYASTIARSEHGALVVHYWSKGAFFRAEAIRAGHQIVTIIRGETYYVFDGASGGGAAIGRHRNAVVEDDVRGRSFGMELVELRRQGGEKVDGGALPESGIEYEIYQMTNKGGRTRVSVAVTDYMLPFRVETFLRSSGETSILEYSGWQRGLPLADSFFEPPSQLELSRFSYEEYVSALASRKLLSFPVYYGHLLHGTKPN